MKTLRKEQLIPYLKGDVKVLLQQHVERGQFDHPYIVVGITLPSDTVSLLSPNWTVKASRIQDIRPILRPMSDLKKEINHEGEQFVPYNRLCDQTFFELHGPATQWPYHVIEQLIHWNFDVFNLIPEGLAVDINKTLQLEPIVST